MLGNSFRCYHIIKYKQCVLAAGNDHLVQTIAVFLRNYAKDKSLCCKDVLQTSGKTVQSWPKPDPPPTPWRPECPSEPQPVNYDPYRIKVPDIVVPPLPPSNAKELPKEDSKELFNNAEIPFEKADSGVVNDLFHNAPVILPDYWKTKPEKRVQDFEKETLPKLGYHGRTKYKYAFHEPWKPLDRLALMEQVEKEEMMPVEADDKIQKQT